MSDKQDEVPLPEPFTSAWLFGAAHDVFTRDQLIAYGNACARAATERAAQVCREFHVGPDALWVSPDYREGCSDAADAILADAGIKGGVAPNAEAMWDKFITLLNEKEPLRTGQHVSFLGSIESYKRIFMEANK